jgi:nicotinate-nucleotide adenylyltransferase
VKIGILGGTFDPPHVAHLIAAELAVGEFALDKMLWMPATQSPLKSRPDISSVEDRLAMTRLAIQGNPKFEVSRIELDRGGASFAIETLRSLRKQFADAEMYLLIGRDQFEQFASWRKPEEILRLAKVIVMDRPGDAANASTQFDTSVTYLTMPLLEISATEIRRRVRADESIRYQVPDAVIDYIQQHKLYT